MSEHNPAHDQINDLFSKAHASIERLDYFMCTVAGGLFAYIGQGFNPRNLSGAASTVTLGALFLLAVSFAIGVWRIRTSILVTRCNQNIIASEELIAKMVKRLNQCRALLKEGRQLEMASGLGEPYTVDNLETEKKKEEANLNTTREQFKKALRESRYYGVSRDVILLLGFVCILVAKLLLWMA